MTDDRRRDDELRALAEAARNNGPKSLAQVRLERAVSPATVLGLLDRLVVAEAVAGGLVTAAIVERDELAARLATLEGALQIIADGTSYDPAGSIGVAARNIANAALRAAAREESRD